MKSEVIVTTQLSCVPEHFEMFSEIIEMHRNENYLWLGIYFEFLTNRLTQLMPLIK